MKLKSLMEHHLKHESQGLPGSFGDGYLLANNAIYRKVRAAALTAGYRLSSEKNDAYETFPLLQLESIHGQKTLPYCQNVSALAHFTPAQLEALSWEDIDGNLKKNFVFHEASHAIARHLADKILGPAEYYSDPESQRRWALRMLLEESCANTCELLGIVDVNDQVHRIFFAMNSYMANFENRTHLKNALSQISEAIVIKFMILAYLQANFLRDSFEDRLFHEMVAYAADGAPVDQAKTKVLRSLGKTAFQLSERFRIQTTGFHLRLAGIKTAPEALFKFDFMVMLKEPPFRDFINQFVAALI